MTTGLVTKCVSDCTRASVNGSGSHRGYCPVELPAWAPAPQIRARCRACLSTFLPVRYPGRRLSCPHCKAVQE